MVYPQAEHITHKKAGSYIGSAQISSNVSSYNIRGSDCYGVYQERDVSTANSGNMGELVIQTKAPTWDILNAGPLHRFTVQGLLVHNCVIIDYADLLAPPPGYGRQDYRHQTNATWQRLRQLSQSPIAGGGAKPLVITATQANRAAYGAGLIQREHIGEDKRKLAHVTGCVGLTQSDEEQDAGLVRLNWLERRGAKFSRGRAVTVAGCLALGRPAVLSAW